MQTVEIPRNSWLRTLDELSTAHQGVPISVDVLGPEIGAQPEVRDLPLVGVVAEPPDRGGSISVSAAGKLFEQVTHIIRSPRRVWIERTDEGADVALQVESEEGGRTIVRFESR